MPRLLVGDCAPVFRIRSSVNPEFNFDTVAGHRVILFFAGSVAQGPIRDALASLVAIRDDLPRFNAHVFVVTADPRDAAAREAVSLAGGYTVFWDDDLSVARAYGVARPVGQDGAVQVEWAAGSIVLDDNLRIAAMVPALDDPKAHGRRCLEVLSRMPPYPEPRRVSGQAPVLLIPDVFPRAFCRRLIELYEADGGRDSGYMTEKDGKTIGVMNYSHKRRRDFLVEDEQVKAEIRAYIFRRVTPELKKAFNYTPTRMERYLVACYEGETGGHFRAHRDNTTKGTAHRRFAMSINLNAEEFEGGELRFAEYGRDLYRPPTGGACVFSCCMLHEATPVTAGKRYCFLPFFYDEEAARIREANQQYLAGPDPFGEPVMDEQVAT